jgi:rfaE bifunctional protein kinase chain/domain
MSLGSVIDRFEGQRILVFGDLVADMVVYGEISRISREAPVLILNHSETQMVPGGAANAVHNLWALGAHPVPVGIVGHDVEGEQLLEYFNSLNIDTTAIRRVTSYRTPTKTRVVASAAHAYQQQVLRLDRGAPVSGETASRAVASFLRNRLRKVDAVLVSDYGYGLVQPDLTDELSRARFPVTVDSRYRLRDFPGLTAATPNEPEVEEALGIRIGDDLDTLERAGRELLRRLKHDALLITRGKDGMALFEPRRRTKHIPIYGTDEIADVTGAGDTVISVFTLALSTGATFADAAQLANYAGGLAVMKHGTRTVTRDELSRAVASDDA